MKVLVLGEVKREDEYFNCLITSTSYRIYIFEAMRLSVIKNGHSLPRPFCKSFFL